MSGAGPRLRPRHSAGCGVPAGVLAAADTALSVSACCWCVQHGLCVCPVLPLLDFGPVRHSAAPCRFLLVSLTRGPEDGRQVCFFCPFLSVDFFFLPECMGWECWRQLSGGRPCLASDHDGNPPWCQACFLSAFTTARPWPSAPVRLCVIFHDCRLPFFRCCLGFSVELISVCFAL